MWGVVGGRRMYGLFDAMHFNTLNAWFITLVGLGLWVVGSCGTHHHGITHD
jgi:type IV secretory pathway TrbD component